MTLFALTVLQATVACLLAGLLLRCLLPLAQRRWPALAAQRSAWLASLLVLAAVFLLPLLPHGQQISVVPEISLAAAVPAAADAILPLAASASLTAASPELMPAPPVEAPSATAWLGMLATVWLGIYLLGLAMLAWRRWRGRHTLRALLQAARPLATADLAAHGAFAPAQLCQLQAQRIAVLEIDAPISAMLVGVWRPRLLLPAHLRHFTPGQQQLVIEHELTHARRRDSVLQLLASGIQLLLWFNPAAGWLAGKLAWAQELGCDSHVLAGRPQQQRRDYAAALVRQLGLQTRFPAGLAFGGQPNSMLERVARMRDSGAGSMHWRARLGMGLALCTLGAASVALQPALAWQPAQAWSAAASVANPGQVPAAAPAPEPWRNPLASMRVTGFFGVVRPITQRGLRGLDLAARRGTPVQAVADGIATVTQDAWLGKAVHIAHGGGLQSVYAHLDSVALADGAIVVAGQHIGTVGDTGRATGPHLHFQVRQHGQLQDPQTRLAGLDANASARALRMRKEQFGR